MKSYYNPSNDSNLLSRIFSVSCLVALCILFHLGAISNAGAEVDYTLKYRTIGLIVDQKCAIRISSKENIVIKDLPDHPNITWLKEQHITKDGEQRTYILFVPHHKGTLILPNIPVKIGSKDLLLPIDPFTVSENLLPADSVFIRELWNGKVGLPKVARSGQIFDLDLLVYVKKNEQDITIIEPKLDIPSARWLKIGSPSVNMSRIVRSSFFSFGSKNYEQIDTTYKGEEYSVRRYKLRFSVGTQKELKGIIEYSVSYGGGERTFLNHVNIPISKLPPLPEDDNLTHTNLVGNWIFKADPLEKPIVKGEPFTLKLQMEGTGDPYLLAELPLAVPGFKSMGYEVKKDSESSVDYWRGTIIQKLLPTGESQSYPELNLTSFDPALNDWKIHNVQPALTVEGADEALLETGLTDTFHDQEENAGKVIARPVLNNLSLMVFLVIGIAPLLPFIFRFISELLKKRKSEKNTLRKKFKVHCKNLDRASWNDAHQAKVDLEAGSLPLLRTYLKLPSGSSVKEISTALEGSQEEKELSGILSEYVNASYTGKQSIPDPQRVSALLKKISITISSLFLILPQVRAANLDEANELYRAKQFSQAIVEYEKLIEEQPNHVNLQYNLANALAKNGQPHKARATYHTTLLLDPFHKKAKENLNILVEKLGENRLPGSHVFNMRPDQYLTLAAIIWLLAWIYFSLSRIMKGLPTWPFYLCLFLCVPLLIGTAFWKLNTSYQANQYMVTTTELLREKTPGFRDLKRLPLASGTIVTATKFSENNTHILVESADTKFWLPLDKITPIW